MNARIQDLVLRIHDLQNKLEEEFEHSLGSYDVEFRKKIACFRQDVIARQKKFKQNVFSFIFSASFLHILVAPVIYSMLVPIVLLDLWVTLYQAICFRAYKIPRVKRSTHVVIDRHHLAYLNGIEKLNCLYCGYGNGVFAYARSVAARTEQFWCPIKHARRLNDPHHRYFSFLAYGDAEGFRKGLEEQRKKAQTEKVIETIKEVHS